MLLPAGVDPHTYPLDDLARADGEARRGGTTTLGRLHVAAARWTVDGDPFAGLVVRSRVGSCA